MLSYQKQSPYQKSHLNKQSIFDEIQQVDSINFQQQSIQEFEHQVKNISNPSKEIKSKELKENKLRTVIEDPIKEDLFTVKIANQNKEFGAPQISNRIKLLNYDFKISLEVVKKCIQQQDLHILKQQLSETSTSLQEIQQQNCYDQQQVIHLQLTNDFSLPSSQQQIYMIRESVEQGISQWIEVINIIHSLTNEEFFSKINQVINSYEQHVVILKKMINEQQNQFPNSLEDEYQKIEQSSQEIETLFIQAKQGQKAMQEMRVSIKYLSPQLQNFDLTYFENNQQFTLLTTQLQSSLMEAKKIMEIIRDNKNNTKNLVFFNELTLFCLNSIFYIFKTSSLYSIMNNFDFINNQNVKLLYEKWQESNEYDKVDDEIRQHKVLQANFFKEKEKLQLFLHQINQMIAELQFPNKDHSQENFQLIKQICSIFEKCQQSYSIMKDYLNLFKYSQNLLSSLLGQNQVEIFKENKRDFSVLNKQLKKQKNILKNCINICKEEEYMQECMNRREQISQSFSNNGQQQQIKDLEFLQKWINDLELIQFSLKETSNQFQNFEELYKILDKEYQNCQELINNIPNLEKLLKAQLQCQQNEQQKIINTSIQQEYLEKILDTQKQSQQNEQQEIISTNIQQEFQQSVSQLNDELQVNSENKSNQQLTQEQQQIFTEFNSIQDEVDTFERIFLQEDNNESSADQYFKDILAKNDQKGLEQLQKYFEEISMKVDKYKTNNQIIEESYQNMKAKIQKIQNLLSQKKQTDHRLIIPSDKEFYEIICSSNVMTGYTKMDQLLENFQTFIKQYQEKKNDTSISDKRREKLQQKFNKILQMLPILQIFHENFSILRKIYQNKSESFNNVEYYIEQIGNQLQQLLNSNQEIMFNDNELQQLWQEYANLNFIEAFYQNQLQDEIRSEKPFYQQNSFPTDQSSFLQSEKNFFPINNLQDLEQSMAKSEKSFFNPSSIIEQIKESNFKKKEKMKKTKNKLEIVHEQQKSIEQTVSNQKHHSQDEVILSIDQQEQISIEFIEQAKQYINNLIQFFQHNNNALVFDLNELGEMKMEVQKVISSSTQQINNIQKFDISQIKIHQVGEFITLIQIHLQAFDNLISMYQKTTNFFQKQFHQNQIQNILEQIPDFTQQLYQTVSLLKADDLQDEDVSQIIESSQYQVAQILVFFTLLYNLYQDKESTPNIQELQNNFQQLQLIYQETQQDVLQFLQYLMSQAFEYIQEEQQGVKKIDFFNKCQELYRKISNPHITREGMHQLLAIVENECKILSNQMKRYQTENQTQQENYFEDWIQCLLDSQNILESYFKIQLQENKKQVVDNWYKNVLKQFEGNQKKYQFDETKNFYFVIVCLIQDDIIFLR